MLIDFLVIQTVLLMKSNQKMFMKNFLNINTCSTLADINQSFFDETNKKVPGKMKDEFKGTSINKFIGLKSEMYCIASHDDIENNTAKGVNISIIEFN